jgi:putative oxidoreductase
MRVPEPGYRSTREVDAMSIGLLLIRLTVGGLFIGHGCQKLFGWFGGGGLDGTGEMFTKAGLRPGWLTAAIAGTAETVGGSLLLLGALVPLAAAAIATVMAGAIITVHLRNGVWNTNGGFEFPLVMAAVVIGLAFSGPGRFSIDHAASISMRGVLWGLMAVGLSLIGALAIAVWKAIGSRMPTEADEKATARHRRAA